MLVVIAIIAILAAILFPVFAQAKAAAKKATCISNLKQQGLGANMYATDYDDLLPDVAVYGDQTFAGNIATYRSQILSIINSTPPYLTIKPSGANVLLCWPNTGAAYSVQTATDPSAANWTTLTLTQTITNAQVCVTVPRTNAASFFRLKK